MKPTGEQIEKAVRYWTAVLANPTFKTLSEEERVDPKSQSTALAEVMALAFHKSPEIKKLEQFADSLRARLKGEIDPFGLSVDYWPSRKLREAAEEVGIQIDINTFPWKTDMIFREDGRVSVSAGYGAEYIDLP